MKPIIRMATLEDAEAILEIYNPYIQNTAITFEYLPLTVEEFQTRMKGIMAHYPYIVCELDGKIVGYAYTSTANVRAAYSWNCDASIYLDSSCHGKGIGSLLYKTLFLIMKEMGYYNVYALVTSQNPVSLAFHQHLGFVIEGAHEKTGYKFGKWMGVTLLVKQIGDFSKEPQPVKSIHEIEVAPLLCAYTD